MPASSVKVDRPEAYEYGMIEFHDGMNHREGFGGRKSERLNNLRELDEDVERNRLELSSQTPAFGEGTRSRRRVDVNRRAKKEYGWENREVKNVHALQDLARKKEKDDEIIVSMADGNRDVTFGPGLEVISIRPSSSTIIASIDISWHLPNRKAFIQFEQKGAARDEVLPRNFIYKGRKIVCHMHAQRVTVYHRTLTATGFSADTTAEEIRALFPGGAILRFDPPAHELTDDEHNLAVKKLFQFEETEGDTMHFELHPNDTNHQQSATVKFTNPARAESIFNGLDHAYLGFLGNNGLKRKILFSTMIEIDGRVYSAIRHGIEELSYEHSRHGVELRTTGKKIIWLHITGPNRTTVATIRNKVRRLSTGTVLTNKDGQALWDPQFDKDKGKSVFVEAKKYNIEIFKNSRLRQILLYAPQFDHQIAFAVITREMQAQELASEFQRFQEAYAEHYTFPHGTPIDVAEKRLESLKERIPAVKLSQSVALHVGDRCIQSYGATISEREIINAGVLKDLSDSDPAPVCIACLCHPSDPVTANCGHVLCRECFEQCLESIREMRQLPIRCFATSEDDTQCSQPFSLRFLQRSCKPETLQKLYQASLEGSLQKHHTDYYLCRTPDCPILLKTSSKPATALCRNCGASSCAGCKADSHPGLTCEAHKEAEEKKNSVWLESARVKQCPKCDFGIQRVAGCDRMRCTRCQTIFCWICRMESSKEIIYPHIRLCLSRKLAEAVRERIESGYYEMRIQQWRAYLDRAMEQEAKFAKAEDWKAKEEASKKVGRGNEGLADAMSKAMREPEWLDQWESQMKRDAELHQALKEGRLEEVAETWELEIVEDEDLGPIMDDEVEMDDEGEMDEDEDEDDEDGGWDGMQGPFGAIRRAVEEVEFPEELEAEEELENGEEVDEENETQEALERELDNDQDGQEPQRRPHIQQALTTEEIVEIEYNRAHFGRDYLRAGTPEAQQEQPPRERTTAHQQPPNRFENPAHTESISQQITGIQRGSQEPGRQQTARQTGINEIVSAEPQEMGRRMQAILDFTQPFRLPNIPIESGLLNPDEVGGPTGRARTGFATTVCRPREEEAEARRVTDAELYDVFFAGSNPDHLGTDLDTVMHRRQVPPIGAEIRGGQLGTGRRNFTIDMRRRETEEGAAGDAAEGDTESRGDEEEEEEEEDEEDVEDVEHEDDEDGSDDSESDSDSDDSHVNTNLSSSLDSNPESSPTSASHPAQNQQSASNLSSTHTHPNNPNLPEGSFYFEIRGGAFELNGRELIIDQTNLGQERQEGDSIPRAPQAPSRRGKRELSTELDSGELQTNLGQGRREVGERTPMHSQAPRSRGDVGERLPSNSRAPLGSWGQREVGSREEGILRRRGRQPVTEGRPAGVSTMSRGLTRSERWRVLGMFMAWVFIILAFQIIRSSYFSGSGQCKAR